MLDKILPSKMFFFYAGTALSALQSHFTDSERPVLFLGDFNTPSDYPLYQILSEGGASDEAKLKLIHLTSIAGMVIFS